MPNKAPVINNKRLLAIAELAEAIAEEHFPGTSICPATLIARKGITSSFGEYGDGFDGMLEHRAGSFHIYCNTQRSSIPTRVRFTLSHELGHYFIDEHRRALEAGLSSHGSVSEGQSDNPAEREADHFASHFLMPRSRFRKTAKAAAPGLPAILSLAEKFDVSLTGTANAWLDLDCVSATIIKWNPDGTFWKRFSPSTYRAGYKTIVGDREKVPIDSPTGRAFRNAELGNKVFYEGSTVASQWFPSVRQGGDNDVLVHEHAFNLREFGYLTVIFPVTGHYPR